MSYDRCDCDGFCKVITVQIPGPQGPKGIDGTTPESAVLYTPQTPSLEERMQAQKNLGVAGDGTPSFLEVYEKAKQGE